MIVRTPTTDDIEEPITYQQNSQSGSIGGVLAYVTLVMLTAAALGFMWLSIGDRLNGMDAWREVDIRKQMDGFHARCDAKYDQITALQEWAHQKKYEPPPTLLVNTPCVQPDAPSRPTPSPDPDPTSTSDSK